MSSDPYQRFSKILRNVLEDNESIFTELGVDIDTIGSHSTRKGAATYCSTGSTVPLRWHPSACKLVGVWGL